MPILQILYVNTDKATQGENWAKKVTIIFGKYRKYLGFCGRIAMGNFCLKPTWEWFNLKNETQAITEPLFIQAIKNGYTKFPILLLLIWAKMLCRI